MFLVACSDANKDDQKTEKTEEAANVENKEAKTSEEAAKKTKEQRITHRTYIAPYQKTV